MTGELPEEDPPWAAQLQSLLTMGSIRSESASAADGLVSMAGRSVVLNFLPVRSGGGLQNTLSFLESLGHARVDVTRFLAVVRRDTAVHEMCRQIGLDSLVVNDSMVSRICFELSCQWRLPKGVPVFTMFGPPPLGGQGRRVNIVGFAYSNLLYPEVDFWSGVPLLRRARNRVVDSMRRFSMARADFWVFETEVLRQRAVAMAGFPKTRVGVVPMAPSSLVTPQRVDARKAREFEDQLRPGVRFLFLAGPHPNKRLHLLPTIASFIKARENKPFRFVTTLPAEAPYTRSVAEEFSRHGMGDVWCNVGPIHPSAVASLVSRCDVVALISRLESFSNNFVEAWQMGKPLVATDADWARHACGAAALYVEPEDADATARSLMLLMRSGKLRAKLVENGYHQLEAYPDSVRKLHEYLEMILVGTRSGVCTKAERRMIRWS